MESELHWSIWLISGVGTGMLALFGEQKLMGILQGLIVVGSPVVIFMKAGAAILPFALFYGGLVVATSVVFKLRRSAEDKKLREAIDKKKRSHG